MVKLILDFIQFLYTLTPLLTSLAILTLLAIILSRSIKKHATIYYIVMAIPFFLVAIPFIGRLIGVETFNANGIPFLGGILRDYIHMGTLGFPLLVIIMYIGALNPKNTYVKKLMSIRKELSIISGFPILTHSLVRAFNNFPNGLKYFVDHEGYITNTPVVSELGAGFTNFSYVLGILMVALFLPLWITSFDSVHKRMGNVKWKKLQKWSYVLYAMLFIHAIGIQVGGMLNPRQRHAPQQQVEVVTEKTESTNDSNRGNGRSRGDRDLAQASERVSSDRDSLRSERGERRQRDGEQTSERSDRQGEQTRTERGERGDRAAVQSSERQASQGESARPAGGGRQQSKGFSDIEVNQKTKRYVHIASLVLIFGSYLYLRVRKAKKDTARKQSGKEGKNQ